MTSIRLLAVGAVALLAVGFALAQGPRRDVGANVPLPPESDRDAPGEINADDPFSLSIDVNLVNVDVVVTDNDDNPLSGLQKEHFRVFVDDQEQTITNFRPTDAPLTVVLLIEFGNTFAYYYDDVVGPAWGFIQSLRENDWAAIVAYDLRPEILTDFTQNQGELVDGLRRLQYPAYSETALFDALQFTLERMQNVDGKKAIFLLSSGINTIGRTNYSEALKMAEASDTIIYAVGMGQLYRTVYESRMGPMSRMTLLQAENTLRSLAKLSGGVAFFPRFQGEYPGIYETIGLLLRYQYSLGFVPTNLKPNDKLRELRIEVGPLDLDKDGKPDKLKVRHKKGFYLTDL